MISLICLLKLPNKIIKLGSKEAPAFSSGIRLASYIAGKSVNNPQNLNPHINHLMKTIDFRRGSLFLYEKNSFCEKKACKKLKIVLYLTSKLLTS